MKRLVLLVALSLVFVAGFARAQTSQLGPPNLYPDATLTPGEVFIDAGSDQICVSGYTRTVRDVTASERAAVWAEYGLVPDSSSYEVDHFIPLELGGDNAIANLWPEPYAYPGAHEKDQVENYLHDQVCGGALAFDDAQAEIVADWYAVWLTLPNANPPPLPAPGGPAPSQPSNPPASTHTWYTSSFRTSNIYYCDDDPEWRTLSPRDLELYPTVAALLAVYPAKHLHRPCLDGATGP